MNAWYLKFHYPLVEWEIYEHHKAIINRPGYPDFIGFVPSIGQEASVKYVDSINTAFLLLPRLSRKPLL